MWRGSEGQREGECMLTHVHAGAEPGLVRPKAYTIFLGGGGGSSLRERLQIQIRSGLGGAGAGEGALS